MGRAVRSLIVACALVSLAQTFDFAWFVQNFGLIPRDILQHHRWWQLVTYMFLHGGLFHLLFNMLALWMFGRPLESRWGTKEFFRFYFFTGISAGVLTLLLNWNSPIPSIGASGAIYGILVAYAMTYPESTIYLYFLIPLSARQMVILFAFIEFYASMSGTSSGIARFAHLGGMLAGYLYLKGSLLWEEGLRPRWKGFSVLGKKSRPKFTVIEPEDLSREVDRILDKILLKGAASLTREEQEIMRRFSQKKK